jgi:hypothetical protein
VLRYVIPRLAGNPVLGQIVHLDLVADPTAQGSVDSDLAHGGPYPRRTTGSGLDTWAGELVDHGDFHQARYPDAVARVTYQYCIPYDVVCDANLTNVTPWNLAAEGGRHSSYPWRTIGAFAAEALGPVSAGGGGGDTGSSSSGSGSGGSSGSVSGSGGSGSGSGGAQPTGSTTYAETTGSVTHTWTDYSDAGGTEGPSIASNQTVQVTCEIVGFEVADGNTWWYQVASSPWSNAYYASADAFYNDGETSGSLLGTPFVDANVPTCAGSAAPPGTYSETSGSVVHTWTNYSDAGGTEGPEIPSNDTVQIQCRVNGFAVADGNTWWYEIASSPWNNDYYASADAFYNNGQTSGSLVGTPFVDPNVRNC